jgi:AcrR family transcriptional regulator
MSSADDRQQTTVRDIPQLRTGICFKRPEPLPRGRHDLTREQILTAQAERLMIAVTELLAEHGFGGVGIREITARAGVSRGAFYECFPSKEACAFAAYRRWVDVLLGRFTELPTEGVTLEQLIEALLHAYLGLMEDDPVCARAFLVEFDGLGREARDQRRIALRRLAEYISVAQTKLERADGGLVLRRPLVAYVGILYACRQVAVDLLDEEPAPNLRVVVPELAEWAAASLSVK